jgi:hypothetical protein
VEFLIGVAIDLERVKQEPNELAVATHARETLEEVLHETTERRGVYAPSLGSRGDVVQQRVDSQILGLGGSVLFEQ